MTSSPSGLSWRINFCTASLLVSSEMNTYTKEDRRGYPADDAARGPLQDVQQPLTALLGDGRHRLPKHFRSDRDVRERDPSEDFVHKSQRLVAERGQVSPLDPAGDALDHLRDLNDRKQHDQAERHDDACEYSQQGERGRSTRAQSFLEPVVQRAEQIGDHRGDHDENEVAPQEEGGEQDGQHRRDRQRTLLGQREFGIHCGHWHTVASCAAGNPICLANVRAFLRLVGPLTLR